MTFHSVFTTAATPAISPRVPDETWTVFRTLRDAARGLGLKPTVIATLGAMVSCLKPGKGMICFASNAELQRRLSGISDKTIRCHARALEDAGILRRQDSPNRKRFASRDPSTGQVEAYGFDLTPMIENAHIWEAALEAQQHEMQRARHLRTRLLARLAWIDARGQDGIDTPALRTLLRRKLTSGMIEEILEALPQIPVTTCGALGPADREAPATAETSVSAGQNDRHHSMSETEDHDSEEAPGLERDPQMADREVLRKMEAACSTALQFRQGRLRDWLDIENHAAFLAPMIGIDRQLMHAARARHGTRLAALSILLMVQLQPRIRNMQAYFRSLVSGKRSDGFDPLALLDRMAAPGGAMT